MSLARNVVLISASAASSSSAGSNTIADAPRRVASFAALLARVATSTWRLAGSSFSFAEEAGGARVAIGMVPWSFSVDGRSMPLTPLGVVPLAFAVTLLLLERFLSRSIELVLAIGVPLGHRGSGPQIEKIGQQSPEK